MEKKYVLYYDLIKIAATFMVCFYHVGLLDVGTVSESFYIPNMNKLVLNFCAMSVPLFFMVNGALMLRRPYSFREIVLRTLKIIFLYYFWVIATGEFGAIFFGIERLPLLKIITGNRNTISVHLWFLRTIAILSLMVPVLKKIYEQKSKKIIYGLMGGVLLFPFLYNYFVLIVRWCGMKCFQNLSVSGAFTMYSILYFLLGKIISDFSAGQTDNYIKCKTVAVISIVAGWLLVSTEVTLWSTMQGTVYDGVNSSFPTIGALLMAAGVFYLFSKYNKKLNNCVINIVKKYADNIMGVYIFHMVFVHYVLRYVHRTVSVFGVLVITIIIMLVSVILTIILKKIPIIRDLLII